MERCREMEEMEVNQGDGGMKEGRGVDAGKWKRSREMEEMEVNQGDGGMKEGRKGGHAVMHGEMEVALGNSPRVLPGQSRAGTAPHVSTLAESPGATSFGLGSSESE
ncbi:unnamed protein product [Lampetra fluviatilis]